MSDKQEWQRVKFGDVVKLNTERCANPTEAGIERYVGLDHIEPQDLRIRRWGLVADGTTFTNLFRPGQVLFGKRRAYQRKVAVADFTGVCSGDIYAFESKDAGVLFPELLPFICQTDDFFDHAVGTSAGSLSPRTNWTQLAQYEFALPPLDEQRRIAKLVNAMDVLSNELESAHDQARVVEESLFDSLVNPLRKDRLQTEQPKSRWTNESWQVMKISDIGDVAYGISAAVSNNTESTLGWPILTGANITLDGTLDLSKIVYHPIPKKQDFILRKGDVLFNWRSGSQEHVGKVAIFELDGYWTFASFILRIRTNELMNNVYLWRLLNFMRSKGVFRSSTSQQVNFKMNARYFRDVKVTVPPRYVQDEVVGILYDCWDAQNGLKRHLAGLNTLYSTQVNASLGH